MQFITDCADQGVLVPAWLVLVAGLTLLGWRRGALAWLVVMAGAMAVLIAMKAAIAAGGPIAGVYSPSGHTMTAAVMAGGAWTFASPAIRPWPRVVAAALTALAAGAVIGVSRVSLDDHTVADVIAAMPLATAAAALLVAWARPRPRAIRLWPAVTAAMLMAVAMHGRHVSAETMIATLMGNGATRPEKAIFPAQIPQDSF